MLPGFTFGFLSDPGEVPVTTRRSYLIGIFLVSLAIFSLARAQLVSLGAAGTEQTRYLTGDEPAYLILTHSLVVDGDFNLYNNRVNGDGRFFGKEKIDAHGARKDWEKREIYSIHTPGPAILLAPAYAAGLYGPLAPRVTVCIFVNILAALLAVNVFLFCVELSGGAGSGFPARKTILPAIAGTAATVLTAPVIFYSNLAYPELPAALFIVYALRQALTRPDPGAGNRLAAVLAAAFLPWFNFRFLLPALVLLGIMLWRRPRHGTGSRGERLILLGVFCISAGLLLGYQYRAFGTISPTAAYLYQDFAPSDMLSPGFLDGAFGLIVDRGHGILTWSPVYILSLTGLVLLLRRRPREGLPIVLLLLAILLPGVSYFHWWGGFAPPPRYFVAPAALLGGALCYALSQWPRRSFVAVFSVLLAASLYFGYLGSRFPTYLYRHRHIITTHYPEPMIAVFPSFFKKRPSTWPLAAAWTSAILLLNGFFLVTWNRRTR